MNSIEIRHLHKQYRKTKAVEDLSLAIPAGSFFGFLGPNGAGKSTTIGCLTGLLDPSAGSIHLLGEQFDSNAIEIKRRIGVMPENLALFEGLYAHEFLSFQARMYGLDKTTAQRRTIELIAAMELTGQGRKPLAEFSSGMRKRVSFAAAIIANPEIVFLDEPFESIDPSGVSMMKQWLIHMVSQGKTVFLTTHVLESVERLCSRIAIIKKPGKLIWEGDITPLSHGRPIVLNGQECTTLEELYMHVSGERAVAPLAWF